jgi:hypothetical protein
MPAFPQLGFPTLDETMQLVRSIVNDTFPGIAGQQGRIFTNNAPFTVPLFNSAFRKMQRKMRLEGATFPIKDNVILNNVTPVVTTNANVQVSIGFDGYFDGTTMHASPALPSDLLQPYVLEEQSVGTGFPFQPMTQPQEGLPSVLQGAYLGYWEWRNYKIYMVGSTLVKNLRLRYQYSFAPLNVPAADFASTSVQVLDCQDCLANYIAAMYGRARGANPKVVQDVEAEGDSCLSDMAEEYVRRSQTVQYRRLPYGAGGSNDPDGGNGTIGQSGFGA